jgi:single-stranded-DNA-specific exonuclease
MWVKRKENSTSLSASISRGSSENLSAPQTIRPPELIEKLLFSRGIQYENWAQLFEPKLSDLKDPFLMLGMDKAVARLIQAYINNEKICLYADFDLDGTSGLALTKTALEKFGFSNILYYQPRRLKEGYGFHAEAVTELSALNVKVIVTIDVGITSHAACLVARDCGIDVILTDHHLPNDSLPEAYCVVNPNQGHCPSGLGYLSGAGVAFYLIRALRRKLVETQISPERAEQIKSWDLKEILDVFTIATLTDMVPLIDDNRVLVKHGLVSLKNTLRPGLRQLIRKLNFEGKDLTSADVGIRLAPKLNALSRMDLDVLPIHIYLEMNMTRAEVLVEKMFDSNQERLDLQSYAESTAEKLLETWTYNNFIFLQSDQFHRGIIGLVATKLSQSKNKPVFIGSLNSEGIIVGSSRQPDDCETSLVDALFFCGEALNRSGGHYSAAGFELPVKNLDRFIAGLDQFYNIESGRRVKKTEYDLEAHFSDVNDQFLKWHYSLGPFGVGFPEPIFRFDRVSIENVRELKGGHLKLTMVETTNDVESKVEALCFSPKAKVKELIRKQGYFDILGEIQKNSFRNKVTIQILLKDLVASSDAENSKKVGSTNVL